MGTKPTPTTKKVARYLVEQHALHPEARIELTQNRIATAVEVSERSVIRAMSEMQGMVEQIQRGVLRITDLDNLKTLAHTVSVSKPKEAATSCADTSPSRSLETAGPIQIRDPRFDELSQAVAILQKQVASLLQRKTHRTVSAVKRLQIWVERQCSSANEAALRLDLSPQELQRYLKGAIPPALHREIIRARTGIGTQSWDGDLPSAYQAHLPLDTPSSTPASSKTSRAKPRPKPSRTKTHPTKAPRAKPQRA